MFVRFLKFCLFVPFVLFGFVNVVLGQAEFSPWGNMAGIRIHGQLFGFETSLKVISKGDLNIAATGKEMQRPHYVRNGDEQIVTTNIDSLFFTETVKEKGTGNMDLTVNMHCKTDTVLKGVYFCMSLPVRDYVGIRMQLLKAYADSSGETIVQGIAITAAHRKLIISFDAAMPVIIKKDFLQHNILLSFPLGRGELHKGDSLQKTFSIRASGDIDNVPAVVTVDVAKQGSPFEGFGGNFRLQNPKEDPQVIDYSLKNLRVAWGRVEMPWRFWQPKIDVDPTTTDTAKLFPPVKKAMEMAQRLSKMGIPLILTAWAPPFWAIVGKPHYRPVNGVWGNPLDSTKTEEIYKSITDYIMYLKTHYGVEVKLFSFNESDLGINIRVTGEQHDTLIKGLGAYFAAHGVSTKMLLGDNSDATTYKFIYPALNDPAALPYIGAVSFHSWRGWDTDILEKWGAAAKQANLPLIVGEGSIDAQAFGYPLVFQEPTYALQEINLYTRILNICQPLTILQWQLTADYSPLIGGGIFGNNEPLHPGQRFFNLKQLASTPAHLFALPVSSSVDEISAAALGDNAKGIYAIHLVNNGPTRAVTVSGLPADAKVLHLYITNSKLYMKDSGTEKASDGKLTFKMQATSYYTLICSK